MIDISPSLVLSALSTQYLGICFCFLLSQIVFLEAIESVQFF